MAESSPEFELSINLGEAGFEARGPSDKVMQAFANFEKLLGSTPPEVKTPKASRKPADQDGGGTGDKVPFGVFMRKQFANQAQRATAIVTWAKRYENKGALKPGEIETLWKKVAKKPGNPTQMCQNAEKEGWLENQGGGAYAVTGHGEKMVDKLPQAAED